MTQPEAARANSFRREDALLAIDLGAGSCRVAMLDWEGAKPRIRVVHRCENAPLETDGGLRWDLERICAGVDEGLRRASALAPASGVASIGVDGWAVDYVRIDTRGVPLAQPYCYRDERNIAAQAAAHERISAERLYAITGQQPLRFNTVYQLYADELAENQTNARWLNLPEYVLHRLGGRAVAEYTNATHTGLVDLKRRTWSQEIFAALDLDLSLAPPLVATGTVLGGLSGPWASLRGFAETRLIAPACHDTASAIAGIPAQGEPSAYLSSGTWSLLGMLLAAPIGSEEARLRGFTNQGAADGGICFHRNINGLWLMQQCMEAWAVNGRRLELGALLERAARMAPPDALLQVDDPELLLPGEMPRRINAQRTGRGLAPLGESAEDAAEMTSLIFHSLAARYAETLQELGELTEVRPRAVCVVGGGSRNGLLNRLTQAASGLPVHCCHAESATIGNFAIQLAAHDADGRSMGERIAEWARVLAGCSFAE